MNTTTLICSLALSLLASSALACDYPSRVEVPNGDTATKEEMIEVQRSVKDYVATMESYLDCLLEEEKTARNRIEDLSPEDEQLREDLLNKKYNAAVDEMEVIVARFNAEVQAYKARQE